MWPFIPFVCLHPLSCIKQANLHTLAPQQDNHSYRFDSQSTKDALRLARQWLSSCMKDHPECRNEHDAIPSRLIFIGDGVPRLLLSTEISGTPRYATLSHCWGKEEHQTLKRDTMKVFQECIPVEALPKTFKDAIYAAIELGLEYIWIDSLCIVQDDIDDWKMESVKMSSVYGNSTISLAASKATNGSDGMFADRRPGSYYRAKFPVKGSHSVWFNCVAEEFYIQGISSMPLIRRAWVFQERLLAPRTIHFTATEVFWECHSVCACESFPEGVPEEAIADEYSDRQSAANFRKQLLSMNLWDWIVQFYSVTYLTRETDRLVAISGVVRKIAVNESLDGSKHYVAGMWRNNIQNELCWYIEDPNRNWNDNTQYVAFIHKTLRRSQFPVGKYHRICWILEHSLNSKSTQNLKAGFDPYHKPADINTNSD
jgi:hypothetical protein